MTANLGIVNGVTKPVVGPPAFYANTGTMTGTWAMTNAGWVSQASSANELHATPIFISCQSSWDRLGINVTTAGSAGTTATLAVYDSADSDAGFLLPQRRLVDADVAVDSTGSKEATIRLTLNPGVYWLASWSAGTYSQTSTSNTAGTSTFAFANHGGVPGTNSTTFRGGFILSSVTALPTEWPRKGWTITRYVRLLGIRSTP